MPINVAVTLENALGIYKLVGLQLGGGPKKTELELPL
jgi:hypothetical protein